MLTLDQGWPTMNTLPQDLLSIKHTQDEGELYAHHGCARGGVGVLLATGARAGLSRLPNPNQSAHGRRPGSSGSAFSAFSGTGSVGRDSSTSSSSSAQIPIREWEKGYGHVNNFQAACRSARTHDVPSASRWSGISFYENNPAEIKRHLDITKTIDQVDAEFKVAERNATSARRNTLAMQQREAFRRQRLEQAVKYVRAGLPPRASTPLVATSTSFTAGMSSIGGPLIPSPSSVGFGAGGPVGGGFGASSNGGGGAGTMSGSGTGPSAPRQSALAKAVASLSSRGGMQSVRCFSAPASVLHRSISLPPASFHRIYDRMADEKVQASRSGASEAAATFRRIAEEKSKADIDAQVQELDDFEINLTAISRKSTHQQLHVVK